jgi:hypothetical protein
LITLYQKSPNQCNICQKNFTQTNSFLIHLVCQHSVLKDAIPSKSDLTVRTSVIKRNLKCHICDQKSATVGKLLRHIANVHFKEKIMKTYLIDDRKCLFCEYTNSSSLPDLLGHVATKHRVLEYLMPERYFSKVPSTSSSVVAAQASKIKKKKKAKTTTAGTTGCARTPTKPIYKCHVCNFSNPGKNFFNFCLLL